MAPLQVIGAGYGRTGTNSLRIALNKLGYSTHHMCSMYESDRHPEQFIEAYKHPEKPVDWDMIYEGFDAACDWPTVSFLGPLLEEYPNAKVVLTVRDPDSWNVDYRKRMLDMERLIVLDGAWTDPEKFNNEETIKAMFVQHCEWVKLTVPEDRLLIFKLGEGWDRLCQFLDKPVPDEPYPRSNSTEEFNKAINDAFITLGTST